jgi:transcriptional regulator with XRE-family HTH domain
MVLLRHMLGDALRRLRLRQGRTLREVSAAARVSLGYLSEVERGQKEASSELLASICGALGAPLSQVLREVSDSFALAELQNEPVYTGPVGVGADGPAEPALDGAPAPRPAGHDGQVRPVASAAHRVAVSAGSRTAGSRSAGSRLPLAAQRQLSGQRPMTTQRPLTTQVPLNTQRRITVRPDRSIISEPEPSVPVVSPVSTAQFDAPPFERIRDVTNMVPV